MIDDAQDKGTIGFVQEGERVKASTINAIIRALRPYLKDALQKFRMSAPRPRPVTNTGGTEIPAYSPMEITSMSSGVAQISRPTADSIQPGLILFTKNFTIATSATAFAYSAFDEPLAVSTDSDDATVGDQFGTQTDSFELLNGNSGFLCLGAGVGADALMRPFRGVPDYTGNIEMIITNTTGPILTKALGVDREVTLGYDGASVPIITNYSRYWYAQVTANFYAYHFYIWQDATTELWSFNIRATNWVFNDDLSPFYEISGVTFDADGCPEHSGMAPDPAYYYGDTSWEFAQDLF